MPPRANPGGADSNARARCEGMDSLDAASLASALPELPPQPGMSQLRSIQRAASRAPRARGRAQTDSFNWERRVAGRCKLVGSPASRVRHKLQPHRTPLPFYLQGDAQHNSPRALAKRHELLKSVRIARAARQFWDTLGLSEHAALEKSQYLQVHRLLARALAPEMGADDWAAAAEADWRGDLARGRSVTAEAASRRLGGGGKDGGLGVGGACTLSRQMYELSIFEVADLWTSSTSEAEYVTFIDKLFRRVTKPAPRPRRAGSAGRGARGGGDGGRTVVYGGAAEGAAGAAGGQVVQVAVAPNEEIDEESEIDEITGEAAHDIDKIDEVDEIDEALASQAPPPPPPPLPPPPPPPPPPAAPRRRVFRRPEEVVPIARTDPNSPRPGHHPRPELLASSPLAMSRPDSNPTTSPNHTHNPNPTSNPYHP